MWVQVHVPHMLFLDCGTRRPQLKKHACGSDSLSHFTNASVCVCVCASLLSPHSARLRQARVRAARPTRNSPQASARQHHLPISDPCVHEHDRRAARRGMSWCVACEKPLRACLCEVSRRELQLMATPLSPSPSHSHAWLHPSGTAVLACDVAADQRAQVRNIGLTRARLWSFVLCWTLTFVFFTVLYT